MRFLLRFITWLAFGCLMAWILSINPFKEYGWFMGMIHGSLAPFNWVISWFSDAWFVKAPLHTTAYNVFWWIFLVISFFGLPIFKSNND